MPFIQDVELEGTAYFPFAVNDTGGSAIDGSSPLFDVRLCGAAANAAPVYSGTPTGPLSHANYSDGLYECAIPATAANGFSAGNVYEVYVTITADGETPAACVGMLKVVASGDSLHSAAARVMDVSDADSVLLDATQKGAIADSVWDEASAGHTDAGKAGAQLWTDVDAILSDTGTDGVLVSSGAGAGQLDVTGGVVKSNLSQILGTALTETAGQIAAGFKKWFDVATPTGTVNSLPDAVPGAVGGVWVGGVYLSPEQLATALLLGGGRLAKATGAVVTYGTETNTYASTHRMVQLAPTSGFYQVTGVAVNGLDFYMEFDIGDDRVPSEALFHAYANQSAAAALTVNAWNWETGTWEGIYTPAFTDGKLNDVNAWVTYRFALREANVGTGANAGLVRIRITSASYVGAGDWVRISYACVTSVDTTVDTARAAALADADDALTTLVKVGSYQAIDTGAGNLGPTAAGTYECLVKGLNCRIRQTGLIRRMVLRTEVDETAISDVRLCIWRRRTELASGDQTYDRVAISQNLAPHLIAGNNSTVFNFPVPLPARMGDYYGFRIVTHGTTNALLTSVGSITAATLYYRTSEAPEAAHDWEAQSSSAGVVVPCELYMTPPGLVGIGHSLAVGSTATRSFLETYVNPAGYNLPETSVAAYLGTMLGLSWQNMGYGGETSTATLTRFDADCVDQHPQIAVIIAGGINDYLSDHAGWYQTNLDNITAMCEACKYAGILAVVCSIGPCTARTNAEMQEADLRNAALQAIVESYDSAIWVDIAPWVGQFRAGGDAGNLWDILTSPDCDAGDTVHYSPVGYERVAAAIYEALAARMVGPNVVSLQGICTEARLANLDATVSSRSPSATALTNATWTDGRAGNLDNLDDAVTSRAAAGDAMALTPTERTTLTGVIWAALTSGLTTLGSVGKLVVDCLNAAVGSRSSHSAADAGNAAATAILTTPANRLGTDASGKVVASSVDALGTQAKADVNAEADAALADYDPPTKAELDSAESDIRGADGDTLKTLSDQLDVVQADLDTPEQYKADVSSLATSAALTSVAGDVTAVKTTTDRLSTLIVADGPDWHFSANALELGPAGGGATAQEVWEYVTRSLTDKTGFAPSAADVATEVWAATARTLTAFGFGVTVTTNNDKTGYTLTATPPTASEVAAAVWAATARTLTAFGFTVAATVADKTGYSLTAAYDLAKTAAQAGDQMDLVNAPNATALTALADAVSELDISDLEAVADSSAKLGAMLAACRMVLAGKMDAPTTQSKRYYEVDGTTPGLTVAHDSDYEARDAPT